MQHSNRNTFPVWLACLLVFTALVTYFVVHIPRTLSQDTAAGISLPEPPLSSTELVIGADDSEIAAVPDVLSEPATDSEVAVTNYSIEDTALPADLVSDETLDVGSDIHIHRYRNGTCTECGASPEFLTGFLPEEYYQEATHQGTVSLHQYKIKAYANHGEGEFDKCFNVYLPYGYDESRPYDVLVLIHGGGGDQDSWLNTVYDYGDIQMCGRVIFDNIFEKGHAKPCIIVTPVTETNQCQGLTAGIYQMRDELREYILPYVAEHYSTYAADGSLESLQAARDHFGLGGLSNGALFVYEGGMRYNFDLFGSYAAFSGNGEPWITVAIIQDEAYANLPIRCYFTGAGTWNDLQENYTSIGYSYFLEKDSRLIDGKNAWHVNVEGEHEWKVWFTDMYNALPLMFQETD